ncbi:hypothetical protein ABZ791_10895 [Streptomyces huasconensis]|uniref:KTSC domain-containing protein n=1 Tax=Streptomyces huasconensis TaxID=1854574 RepID=A0ABV3LPF5_9ACTN
MQNTTDSSVIPGTVTRRHTFILGKSRVLERDSIVQLDDGSVGLYYVRRDGTTGYIPLRWRTFEKAVQDKRAFESAYLTGEESA